MTTENTVTPASKNFTTIKARLFEDPTPQDNAKGYAIVKFEVSRTDIKATYSLNKATNRWQKNNVVGTVVLWDTVAIAGQNKLRKGDECEFVGEFRTREYKDHDGDLRVKTEFHAKQFTRLQEGKASTAAAVVAAYELLASQDVEEIDVLEGLQ